MMRQILLVVVATFFCVSCGSASQSTQPESAVVAEAAPPADEAPTTETAPPGEAFEIASKADLAFDFKKIKTYAWAAAGAALNDPNGTWTRPDMNVTKEIMFLIDRELRARGFTEVRENPDVFVVYAILVDMEGVNVKDADNSLAIAETVPAGALYIALADASTEEAVWIGAAASKVSEQPETDTLKKRLDYAVTKIISRLPQ